MALTIPNKQTKKHAYLSLYAHEGVLFVDIIDMYMGVCELAQDVLCMYVCMWPRSMLPVYGSENKPRLCSAHAIYNIMAA